MRALTGTIVAAFVVFLGAIAQPARAESKTSEAELHLRKACEAVWTNATESQIDRCTKRAMAAMADENRLRDNELKRLLIDSEQELKTCKQELLQATTAASEVADARRKPEL